MCGEPCIAGDVAVGPNVGIMGHAINFNCQIRSRAEEIENLGAGRMLLAEFMTRWRCA